jgi:hypothetical protein
MKMRSSTLVSLVLAAPGLLGACSSSPETDRAPSAPEQGPDAGSDDAAPPIDAGPEVPASPLAIGQPEKMVSGGARLVDLTTDDYAIYRLGTTLYAAKLEPGAEPIVIVENAPMVQVRGRVVFAWSNIDYTTNLADMVVWTGAHGTRPMGSAFFREGTVAASPDGEQILYLTNPTIDRVDLMLAATGSDSVSALVPQAGLGSNTTCAPQFGFEGGDKIVVGICQPESWDATLQLYTPDGAGGWQVSQLAADGESHWSADASAERIFFTTRASRANVFEAGELRPIDTQVAWGVLTPDGATAFYVVGDQLRRTPLPNIDPVPVIPNEFRSRVGFNSTFSYVLFSKVVSYEAGTRRDLYLSPTTAYNPNAEALVPDPTATISRSAFTADGSHALWMTDVDAQGAGTLHARRVWGGPERTFENVDTVVAASGAVIVFSDARSAPTENPIVANLEIVDLALDAPPQPLQARIVDGRTFGLTSDATRVVYSLPGAADQPDAEGMYVQRYLGADLP